MRAFSSTLAALAALVALGAVPGTAGGNVRAFSTGNNSEIVERVPITRHAGRADRSAMSLRLRRLSSDERVWADAEVEVTLTCVDAGEQCIGRPYAYSPTIGARLALTRSRRSVRGHPLSGRKTLECGQHRPNRNHHCVFTFRHVGWRVSGRPSCFPRRCHLNLVVDAHDPHAQPGNVVVVGTDRPDGSVEGDRGRVAAVVVSDARRRAVQTRRRAAHSIPMSSEGGGQLRVTYSVRMPRLRRGDVIEADASQITDISGLPYAAWVSGKLILATKPDATDAHGLARRVARLHEVTEANGFNCTQGPSAYRTPCLTRKAGVTSIRRAPVDSRERRQPIFLNLVSRSFPKLTTARAGDRARVLAGGHLRARVYRP